MIIALIAAIGVILGVLRVSQRNPGGTEIIMLALFALPIPWIGYGALLESSPWQATLGKRLVGLRVYDSECGRLTFLQATGRNAVKDGPFILLALIPGGRLLTILWLGAHIVVLHRSPVYQAIHDRAAKTWVAAQEQTTRLHLT